MKKRLLNEETTRRFMKLANLNGFSKNFLTEAAAEEEVNEAADDPMDDDPMEEPMGDESPMDEPPMGDEGEPPMGDEPMGDEPDEPMDMEDEPMGDDPMDMGGEEGGDEVTAKTLTDLLDQVVDLVSDFAEKAGVDFEADTEMAMAEEMDEDYGMEEDYGMDEGHGMDHGDMDEADLYEALEESGVEIQEDADLEEEIVNEVARRVALRLVKESKQRK